MEAAGAAAAESASTNGAVGGRGERKAAACDVEALRRCLEENKGDRVKCQAHIDAFRSSCSVTPTSDPPPPQKSYS
ncbi:hypothetical protein ACP4OV_027777 [Aristida adscensionis]